MGKQVFEGVHIADFSWVGVGPQVSRELAEHGATVVRIEAHKRLDQLRLLSPFKDREPGIDRTAFATCYNTNKYGISVDLKTEKGRRVAHRLIDWADIVGESMTPGSMAKMGLGYDDIKRIKPDVIMYSTCQMGQSGPYASLPGYGAIGAAMSGASNLFGWPDRNPIGPFGAYTDFVSPWFLIATLIGAMLYRRRTGEGLYLDMSQIEAATTFLSPVLLDYTVNHRVAQRSGNRVAYAVPHSPFPCKGSDRWVAISIRNDREWQSLADAINDADWLQDAKFSSFDARAENEEELNRLIGRWTIGYRAEALFRLLQSNGVPSGIVQNCHEDIFQDPQLKHRRHFRYLVHPEIGRHAYHAPAYILSKTPNHIHKAGPTLGGDNAYVFSEILGYTDDEIGDMLAEGVITTEADLP